MPTKWGYRAFARTRLNDRPKRNPAKARAKNKQARASRKRNRG